MEDKVEATPAATRKPRKRLCGKLTRAKVETSLAIRRAPFSLIKWKEFAREIERAVDEINHLDREIKRLEGRSQPDAQALRLRELKREIRKREAAPAPPSPTSSTPSPSSATAKSKPSAPRKTSSKPTSAWSSRSPRSTSTAACTCWT